MCQHTCDLVLLHDFVEGLEGEGRGDDDFDAQVYRDVDKALQSYYFLSMLHDLHPCLCRSRAGC